MTRAQAQQVSATVFEDGGALVLARVVDWDGNVMSQAACSSLTYRVCQEGETPPNSTTAVVADTILEPPSNAHPDWACNLPYNFRLLLPASSFPDGDAYYAIEIKVTPASGPAFWIRERVYAQRIATS